MFHEQVKTMRHTVRAYRKAGYCRKLVKGSSAEPPQNGSLSVDQKLEIFKGRKCITDFSLKAENKENRRKSPWRGANKKVQRREMEKASEV